jgi:hypothetical protein
MHAALYRITGNTYNNRRTLRRIRATWNADLRAWEVRAGGNGWDDTVRELRRSGCKVARVD